MKITLKKIGEVEIQYLLSAHVEQSDSDDIHEKFANDVALFINCNKGIKVLNVDTDPSVNAVTVIFYSSIYDIHELESMFNNVFKAHGMKVESIN